MLVQPPSDVVALTELREDLPLLLDPNEHNAVRLRVRQTMDLVDLRGFWLHRTGQYDESFNTVPFFEPVDLESTGEWHDVTLVMTESPFLVANEDVHECHAGFF